MRARDDAEAPHEAARRAKVREKTAVRGWMTAGPLLPQAGFGLGWTGSAMALRSRNDCHGGMPAVTIAVAPLLVPSQRGAVTLGT